MRIVVAGLFGSGSSCLAGVLHHLDIDMGSPFWEFPPKRTDMFYEPYDLSAVLRTFWREPHWVAKESPHVLETIFDNWIRMRELVDPRLHHGAKHPLLCLSLEILAKRWGHETAFLWCERDRDHSIQSLKNKGWNWPNGSYEAIENKLWESASSFFASHSLRKKNVDFERMRTTNGKYAAVDEIIDFLELTPTAEQRANAIDSIIVTR